MSCSYYLYDKGLRFKKYFSSELELDYFLQTHSGYESQYGDFVFSMTDVLPEIVKKLDDIDKKANQVYENNKGEWVYSEDGRSREFIMPYIGVNKYLNSIEIDGHRLFPEFTDAYWEGVKTDTGTYLGGRYNAWAQGQYTKDEIDLFFDGEKEKATPVTDKLQLFRLRRMMENKWENQCLTGSAIHSIYENFFKRDKEGVYRMDKIFDADGKINQEEFDKLYQELATESYDRKKIKAYQGEHTPPIQGKTKTFAELVSPLAFKQAIDMCHLLQLQLRTKFGKEAQFFPEFKLQSDPKWTSAKQLMGIIDLLVLDKDGLVHVVDYKTSPHPFEGETEEERGYSAAKLLAYRYLVGMYGRMLALNGFSITKSQYLVLPIQLAGFKKTNEDEFSYEGLNYKGADYDMFDDITNKVNSKTTFEKLNVIGDYDIPYDVSAPDLLKDVVVQMKKWFPKYSLYSRFTEDDVIEMLKELDAFKVNPETNKREWKPEGSKTDAVVTADSEKELVDKVKKYLEKQVEFRNIRMNAVVNALEEGIAKGTAEVDFPEQSNYGETGINTLWFKLEMSRYCNSSWKLCGGDAAEALRQFGIIMLRNRSTLQYNFVKITTQPPKIKRSQSDGRLSLAGAHQTDLYYQSKQGNLMLQSCQGNIEMMETMLAINSLKKLDGVVGEILVMDPHHGLGLSASNKELLYSFNALHECEKLPVNNFLNGNIKMGGKLHLTQTMLHDIMTMGQDNEWADDFKRFKKLGNCMSMLDDCVNLPKAAQIKALETLIAQLSLKGKDSDPDLLKVLTDLGVLKLKHIALYNLALTALAEAKNIDFRQLLRDHDKWLESIFFMKKGVSGTYLDNPGNLSSETLNLLTKLVTEAYLNVRSDMQKPISEIRDHVEKFKKAKHFGWATEHTIGNLATLYKNLYREDITDDLVFKNPWDASAKLTEDEREFLKYALVEINKNRHGDEAEEVRYSRPREYFRVPLAKGDTSSFASQKGLFAALKDRLKAWNPKTALQRAKETAEGIFDKIDAKSELERRSSENLFEMNNIFSRGERDEERELMLEKHGKEYYETNLETLLLKHDFAYSTKKHIDNVMPMIKAAIVHLTTLGAIQNTSFDNDLKYATEYIRNKIKNESIVDPKYEEANAFANKLKGAASKMVLALSPVQMIYQTLQGIWNDISLITRRPDGSHVFTWSNMWNAAKFVYKDLFNIEDKPTVSSLLNELYGINDMDMNTYMDKIKSDNHGIHNMTSFLFKFASRPDYYNRMTIFLSKMIADGCLEAHKIVDGKLVYDSKLDKRYAAFLNNPNGNSEEINKARSLYYEAAKQFVAEGAKNEDGTLFELDMKHPHPLPRAYTNLEAESMKSLSDTIYGYYSHEKKSMIQSTLLGGLFMQFKTYWSGKKNQYLAQGGVKLEGEWVLYKNGDTPMYYKLDENGLPTEEMTETPNEFPVYRWEGDWKEGILCTLWDTMREMPHKGPIQAIKDKWNCDDPKLRQAYRWNMRQFRNDLIIWLVLGSMCAGALGDWLEEEKKNADKDNVLDGIRLSLANIAIKSLKNSTLDANFIDSIGSVGSTWTPFSFEYYGRQINNVSKVVMGELDAWDTIIKSTAATNSIKPFFDTIKPEWAHRDTTSD